MPARAVVLQGTTKRTERGFRSLRHNELTQMAGRAGRRGIDTEGKCVIALDARDGVDDVVRVVDGSPEPIESQFRLGYGSVALLLATGASPEALRRRVEASFGQYQNLKRIREMEQDLRRLETALQEARSFAAPCGDFSRIGRYRTLRAEVEARRRAAGRGGRRGEKSVIEAEPGRLAVVRRSGAPSLAVDPGPARHPRPPRARGRAAAARRRRPTQGRGHQAAAVGHAASDRPSRSGTGRSRPAPSRRPARRARRPRAAGAGARSAARDLAERDRVPPVPVGLDRPLRPGLARGGAAQRAGGAAPPGARLGAGSLLAGVPPRRRGARAVRRGAGRTPGVQGPAGGRAAPRQRAAGDGGRAAAESWPTSRWPKRRPSARRSPRRPARASPRSRAASSDRIPSCAESWSRSAPSPTPSPRRSVSVASRCPSTCIRDSCRPSFGGRPGTTTGRRSYGRPSVATRAT